MKINLILLFGFLMCFTFNVNAQSLTEQDSLKKSVKSEIDSRQLHGRWHLVEIILKLDESDGLGSKAEESFKTSTASQEKVKKQIQAGELAIITQFNYNNTYTHELVYSNPEVQFPSYKESGTWSFDNNTNQLSRKSKDQEITTLGLTVVKRLREDELVLELKYTDKEYEGIYKGLIQTVFLKRFLQTKAKD